MVVVKGVGNSVVAEGILAEVQEVVNMIKLNGEQDLESRWCWRWKQI